MERRLLIYTSARNAHSVGGLKINASSQATLLNRVMLALGDDRQFWDGRSASVEEVLLHALNDPTEMAADPEETVTKLKDIDGYRLQFECIYGGVSWDALRDAVGRFIRCLVTGSSPCDYQRRWEVYQQVVNACKGSLPPVETGRLPK